MCALVTGVQSCALPICDDQHHEQKDDRRIGEDGEKADPEAAELRARQMGFFHVLTLPWVRLRDRLQHLPYAVEQAVDLRLFYDLGRASWRERVWRDV